MSTIGLYTQQGKMLPFRWLGSAFIMAWVWLLLFSNQSFVCTPTSAALFIGGGCLSFIADRLVPVSMGHIWKKVSWTLSPLLLTLLTFLLCIAYVWPLITFGGCSLYIILFFSGFACSSACCGWIELHSKLKTDVTTIVVLLSLLVSALVYYLLWGLQDIYWGAGWLALPLLSLTLFKLNKPGELLTIAVPRQNEQMPVMEKRKFISRATFLTASFIGTGYAYSSMLETAVAQSPLSLVGVIVVNILTIFALWLLFSRKGGSTILQYAVVLFLVGIAVSMIVGITETASLFAILVGASLSILLFLATVLSTDITSTFGTQPNKALGRVFIPAIFAFIVGMIVEMGVAACSASGDIVSAIVLFAVAFLILVVLLICSPSWIAYELKERENDWVEHLVVGDITTSLPKFFEQLVGDEEDVDGSGERDVEQIKSRIEEIAAEYDFSPRQTEIFTYLARGRNTDYIANKLVVSPNTVRTHIANIYRKLAIHTQQELLNFFYGE